jgi:hypothetical protein
VLKEKLKKSRKVFESGRVGTEEGEDRKIAKGKMQIAQVKIEDGFSPSRG